MVKQAPDAIAPPRFNERPEFAEMVAAGALPPVAERIGQDPLVIRPLDGIGTYGGTIRRAYMGSNPQDAYSFCAGPDSLLYWDLDRERVIPNIARHFELSDDFIELIVYLRRGMRWSDGAPFTADDILFWRNDMSLNREFPGSPSLRVDGREVLVERIDDFTVRYTSPVPNPLLPAFLAGGPPGRGPAATEACFARDVGGQSAGGGGEFGGGGFAPKHYLSQFHPAYTSAAAADALARDAGFPDWVSFFWNRNSWELNPDLPTVTPWVLTRPSNDPPWELSANPYSIWVDTNGNQLPYIGEVTMDRFEDLDALIQRGCDGELDFQERSLEVAQLPMLLENQERGDYAIHQSPREKMEFGLRINLAYAADPVLGDLLRTVEFRRALSLGIDRDQINETFFAGASVPSATMAADTSPYFPGADWRTKWATYDPDQANELLDGLGLTDTDDDGFRLRPDGNGRIRLDYHAIVVFADFPGIGAMIRGQWADIGIDLNLCRITGGEFRELLDTNEIMLAGHTVGTEDPLLSPGGFVLAESGVATKMIGPPYLKWYATNGEEGVEPPESLQLLKDATDLYHQGRRASEGDRVKIGTELFELHADQVWSIGVVGFGLAINGMYLAKNGLRNVPVAAPSTEDPRSPANVLPITFYYQE
jgi:peptide/nickel transport system substrate-binding protein